MSDWMATARGRFVIWWLYMLASLAFVGVLLGSGWVLMQGVERLTGSENVALGVGFVFLMTLVAAFNAWIWTATGNRYVQALMRVMQRMEGRSPPTGKEPSL